MSLNTSIAPARRFQRTRAAAVYLVIVIATLVLVDGICMGLGILPPRLNLGDPRLGWRPAPATGHMALGRCVDFATGRTIDYDRNEDGVRTSSSKAAIIQDTTLVKVAVTGDSHTDLCATNEETHAGVLEATLRAWGVNSVVLGYGAGRYSPLQEYLAFQEVLQPYDPRALVMNVYTGNDFYDLLRSDDRPHLVPTDSGFRIAPPVWYSYDDPADPPRSRILSAARTVAARIGIRSIYFRVSELRRLARDQGQGMITVLSYMRSLWAAREPAVGYPDAFSAQMLNQQLFFHFFPSAERASLERFDALLALVRRQHPNEVLVLSAIPSYELTAEQPVDSLLMRTIERLPITYADGVAQEGRLYDALRALATKNGWIFVDNLEALRAYHGTQRLYNDFDYHILPTASNLIGRAQAAALLTALEAEPGGASMERSR